MVGRRSNRKKLTGATDGYEQLSAMYNIQKNDNFKECSVWATIIPYLFD